MSQWQHSSYEPLGTLSSREAMCPRIKSFPSDACGGRGSCAPLFNRKELASLLHHPIFSESMKGREGGRQGREERRDQMSERNKRRTINSTYCSPCRILVIGTPERDGGMKRPCVPNGIMSTEVPAGSLSL